jgi:Domain of unknown function (DUF5664)
MIRADDTASSQRPMQSSFDEQCERARRVGKWRGDTGSLQSQFKDSSAEPTTKNEEPLSLHTFPERVSATPNETSNVVGRKLDKGKPRLSLLWREPLGPALVAVAQILQYGIEKYKVTAGNWMFVENAEERYTDALYRHLAASLDGHWVDDESKLPHMAHAACNALFVLAIQLKARRATVQPYSEMP